MFEENVQEYHQSFKIVSKIKHIQKRYQMTHDLTEAYREFDRQIADTHLFAARSETAQFCYGYGVGRSYARSIAKRLDKDLANDRRNRIKDDMAKLSIFTRHLDDWFQDAKDPNTGLWSRCKPATYGKLNQMMSRITDDLEQNVIHNQELTKMAQWDNGKKTPKTIS